MVHWYKMHSKIVPQINKVYPIACDSVIVVFAFMPKAIIPSHKKGKARYVTASKTATKSHVSLLKLKQKNKNTTSKLAW